MKFVLSFCFIVSIISLIWAKSITWGKRSATDHLLYHENVIRFPVQGFIQEIYVVYPKLGVRRPSRPENVTAIFVYDRFTNSSGAVATRAIAVPKTNNTSFNSTIIILKSQRSKGINSTVELYGNSNY